MENGEWRMENGEWKMENGEWRMENGEWRTGTIQIVACPFGDIILVEKLMPPQETCRQVRNVSD